ncbi:alpha/beta hydrolase [Enterovirga rhinocerotis]|uniref:Esterase/lipase superfamily enzyme n=1 Tax=Enterovirga rhinocerotis TaxID=1339210 RepID=A0A4R7BKC6_9HYPH|nr:alpha/beta fold hydrolase [Enterovirga rhinocerotis]TDR85483.1 esterase/lipase superfamily enzyme [Enterovirga rhinocerotis]
MKRVASILLLLVLAACGARPGPEALQASGTVPGAKLVTVYVTTSRGHDPGSLGFNNDRARKLSYAEFTISIPPGHQPGQIEWQEGPADPARFFTTVSSRTLDRATFEARLAAQQKKAAVFVHGFNTNFQEAVFRLAQMAADSGIQAVPVLYSWPSAGAVSAYVADRDAVTTSRDSLAEVLTMVSARREALVLAHSMGAWLTMETLRQLRLTGKNAVLNRLKVALAAPDIDVDVFRSQLATIKRMPQTMVVMVSPDDSALAISSRIAGSRTRLGALDIRDPRVVQTAIAANVQIVDISSVQSLDFAGHNRFVEFAMMHARGGTGEGAIGVRKAGAFVFNTIGDTLSTPFNVIGKVVGGEH